MDLNTLWFALIGVLFTGFFLLEGFDFGVGMLLPFLGKNDRERRVVINSIGPFWDANEVWLLTAGGAMFAAFPHWYATLFSGFYLALILMLVGFIIRGVAFEFRSKDERAVWRKFWDWMIFVGSLVPALLWGVAVGNLILGVPIDARMNYTGNFFTLLNPLALLGGLAFVSLFLLHGAAFLTLRTQAVILERARSVARLAWLPATVLVVAFVAGAFFLTDIYSRPGPSPLPVTALAALALLSVGYWLRAGREGWAFVMTGLTIVLATATVFLGMFPRVMISTTNPQWSLTIYNAASSPYTLTIMTVVAAIFVPVVLVYQAYTYWVFRQRVGGKQTLEY